MACLKVQLIPMIPIRLEAVIIRIPMKTGSLLKIPLPPPKPRVLRARIVIKPEYKNTTTFTIKSEIFMSKLYQNGTEKS